MKSLSLQPILSRMTEDIKFTIDAASVGVVASTVMGWLPSIAAGLSIVWLCIRIWESATVQGWVKVWKGDTREED